MNEVYGKYPLKIIACSCFSIYKKKKKYCHTHNLQCAHWYIFLHTWQLDVNKLKTEKI